MATQPLPSAGPARVTITVNGPQILVNPRSLTIDRGQDVEWDCKENWVLVFRGKTPFKKRYFHNGDPNSGPAQKSGTYKYDVFAGEEGYTDPEVIVR